MLSKAGARQAGLLLEKLDETVSHTATDQNALGEPGEATKRLVQRVWHIVAAP